MPLLRRKPFLPEKPPSDLGQNEEILFCELTGEVFRNYDAFYERVILCNSLLWTCERTGRSGLTYKEAKDSEQNVAKLLDAFPRPVASTVLNIVHHTRRSKIADLCDEIYEYLKNRYVKGETIEFRRNEKWSKGIILESNVSANVNTDLNKSVSSENTSIKGRLAGIVGTPDKPIIIDDESQDTSPGSPIDNKRKWPEAKELEYTVLKKDSQDSIKAKGKNIRRLKGVFVKDTIRLFIRKTCVRSTASSDDGYWRVVDKFVDTYNLGPSSVSGPLAPSTPAKYKNKRKRQSDQTDKPEKESSVKKKKKKGNVKEGKERTEKKKKRGSKEKEGESKKKKKKDKKSVDEINLPLKEDSGGQSDKVEQISEEERKKIIEEMRLKRKVEKEEERKRKFLEKEEDKKRRKIEREKEKEKIIKVKELEARFLKEWNKKRDDLKLEDLKKLPELENVQSKLPTELLGDVLMVTEFLLSFGQLYQIEEEIQFQITTGTLEEALLEHDVEGKYYEILKFLLQTFLRVSEEENDEEEEIDSSDGNDTPAELEETEEKKTEKCHVAPSAGATVAAAWPMLHQGQALSQLTLDPFTLSEILRLHILSSGVKIGGALTLWQRRGGFQLSDDPCVHFRHKETALMKSLSSTCIYDLDPSWKLKVLCVLCDQLLTLVTTRDYIEDAFDKIKELKKQLRELHFSEHRRRKVEAAERYKRRLNERAQTKQEILRRKKEKAEREVAAAKAKVEGGEVENNQSSKVDENAMECVNDSTVSKESSEKTFPDEPILTLVKLTDVTKEEEDSEREKQEVFKKKETELKQELLKYSGINGESPLGRDRALNSYWALAGVCGLFVEKENSDVNLLLEGNEDEEISDEEFGNEDDVDIENKTTGGMEYSKDGETDLAVDTTKHPSPSVSLEDIISLRESRSSVWSLLLQKYKCETDLTESEVLPLSKTLSDILANVNDGINPNIYGMCEQNDHTWTTLFTKDTVNNLLDSLNDRGHRENQLKVNLKSNLDRIYEAIENSTREEVSEASNTPPKTKGTKTGDNIDKRLFRSMNDFLEANLRDQILDFEERLWTGGLGILKVDDRALWRKNIDEGIAKLIVWENPSDTNVSVTVKSEEAQPLVNGHASGPESLQHISETDQKQFKSLALKILDSPANEKPERCTTPITVGTPTINPVIKEMRQALFQIEKGIERKFLKPPLGEHEERKKERIKEMFDAAKAEFEDMTARAKQEKKRKKQSNGLVKDITDLGNDKGEGIVKSLDDDSGSVCSDGSEDLKKERTCLERWKASLKSAFNLSQLFIHLNTLDQSVMWDKSVLNARCKKCRRKGDGEQMLLCDGCDRGFHIYCLVPPIKQIPQGDWFCHDCRPKEARRSTRRRKPSKVYYESEEDEEEDEGDEEEQSADEDASNNSEASSDSNEDDEEDSDDDDDDDETEDSSEEGSEEGDEDASNDENMDTEDEEITPEHNDYCSVCGNCGTLICCDSCLRAYHTLCTYPPMKKVPKGTWSCQVCTQAENELPKSKRVVVIEKQRAKEEEAAAIAVNDTGKGRRSSRSKSVPQRSSRLRTPVDDKTKTPQSQKRKRPQSSSPKTGQPRKLRRNDQTEELLSKGKSSKMPSKSPAKSGKIVKKSTTFTFGRYERRQCTKLLGELTGQDDADPFLAPVDTKLVPDYRVYIDQPMDFGTIKRNINGARYNTLDEFLDDVRLVFKNCETYNAPRSAVARAGTRLSLYFEQRLLDLDLSTE